MNFGGGSKALGAILCVLLLAGCVPSDDSSVSPTVVTLPPTNTSSSTPSPEASDPTAAPADPAQPAVPEEQGDAPVVPADPEDTLANGWTPELAFAACTARQDEIFDPGQLISRAPLEESDVHEVDAGVWTLSIPVERAEAGPGMQVCTVTGTPAEPIVDALDGAY